MDALTELADLTGGRVLTLDQAGEVYDVERTPINDSRDVTRSLLIFALLLWLLDIAARRLSIPWAQWIGRVKKRFASRQGREHRYPETTANDSLSRLKERKRQVSQRIPLQIDQPRDFSIAEKAEMSNQRISDLPIDSSKPKIEAEQAKSTDSESEDRMKRLLQAKNRKK